METMIWEESFAITESEDYDTDEVILGITWDMLRTAEIGKTWAVAKSDKPVNRTTEWEVAWKVVYRDDDGVCVVRHSTAEWEKDTIVWLQFAK